ncbi:HAD family acid phosphatase [Parendozoicomonas haliclonae]|uniref:Lipoprotein E n=1 Tax=Parendozoicomonas haliclonae TaxID=1960125 RepID=A0A1X7AKD0_9GAMM|nr:HAD family acid phosphatase [Parendozoicomonas haliclonae]SMA47178.1 Lipoprotein E precursor [Parendozoicomonas haliclonae]
MQASQPGSGFQCPDLTHYSPKVKELHKPDHIASEEAVDAAGRLVTEVQGEKSIQPPANPQEERVLRRLHEQTLTASVWQDTEARAHHRQTFALSREALDQQLAELKASQPNALPVMFVDIDDMLVDSHTFFNGFISQPWRIHGYRDCAWFMAQHSKPLEGAVEFMNYAASRGVMIHYISARTSHPEIEDVTLTMLRKNRFPVTSKRSVHIASDKMAKSQQLLEEYSQGALNYMVADYMVPVYMAGDKRTDIGCPKGADPVRQQVWDEQHGESVGKSLFIQPNTVYGRWETALQFKYDHSPEQEVCNRLQQVHQLAGRPDRPYQVGSDEQIQALLYTQSVERRLALQQALVGAERRCKELAADGQTPELSIQLEGVLLDTVPLVADLITKGCYADVHAYQAGVLPPWLDYGLALADPTVTAFIKRMQCEYGAKVVYQTEVPASEQEQEYCGQLCRWLRSQGVDQEPVISTNPAVMGNEASQVVLVTRNGNQPQSDSVFLVPSPHQLWEWWPKSCSRKTTASRFEAKVRRWQLPEECQDRNSRKACEEQLQKAEEVRRMRELEDDFMGGGGPLHTASRRPSVPRVVRSEYVKVVEKKKPKKRKIHDAR